MTKTDWQALDARIAREVMGWVSQAELVRDGCPDLWWSQDRPGLGAGHWIEDWQPHNDVAQALQALDALMSRFLGVRYVLEYTRSGYWCILRNLPVIGSHHTSQGSTLAKAICLALEKWLDAQKETQDDPG